MNTLKEQVYEELGINDLRSKLISLKEEIEDLDNKMIKISEKRAYIQSEICNINYYINQKDNILSPRDEE